MKFNAESGKAIKVLFLICTLKDKNEDILNLKSRNFLCKAASIFWCIMAMYHFSGCSSSPKPLITPNEECYFVPHDNYFDSIQNNFLKKQNYFQDFFLALEKSTRFQGAVLLAENDQIIYMNAFGKKNKYKPDLNTVETSFQLASVTKIFTSVAILQLWEKEKLDLDDYVIKWIPELPYDNITIRHLLSHRSGIPRYEAFNRKQWNWDIPMRNEDMIKLYAQYKPRLFFKPGRNHDYSNANFAILAVVIERVSGKTYHEYLQTQIFEPANMLQAFVFDIDRPPVQDKIALGHAQGYRHPLEPQYDYLNGVVGDKGIYASVLDLFKFDIALRYEKLLHHHTLQHAFHRTIKKKRTPYDDYGLGHRLKDLNKNNQFIPYHSGWWRGFKSLFIRDVYQHKTIIMLSNREISPQGSIFWESLEKL